MKEMMVLLNTKEIRKAACAVGFGLTIGKFAGDVVKDSILVLATGFLKHKAKKGDKVAQSCCDEANIEYDDETKKTDEDEPKMKMGFNC